MKKGNKLSKSDKVFLIAFIAFVAGVFWVSTSPLSFYLATGLPFTIYYDLPEPEPREVTDCYALGGICVPVEQGCGDDYFDYGLCKEGQICCLEDKCLSTGGRWSYETQRYSAKPTFLKKCLCPKPLEYDIKNGCTKVYR